MKKILLIIFTSSIISYSQNFTRITDGAIVNDGGYSFGAAWGDLNNDGFPDLYVSNGGPDGRDDINFLYYNNGDGTFTRALEGDPASLQSKSNGASIADFNNDGFPDIVMANRNGENNTLFVNNGNKTFTLTTEAVLAADGGNTNSIGWTDYNLDGYPDPFAVNFFGTSALYTNNADGSFSRFPNEHPAKEINTSISSSWGDFDNDGDPDLFIANAEGAGKANLLYVNNGDNSFTLMTSGSIVTDQRASMGGIWGDYDNDGDLDLFVANQANFPNDLYLNNGDGTFSPLNGSDVVTENSLSINGSFADIDNDGDLDLYVTNWLLNKNFLYINSGYPDYAFEKITDNILVEDIESSMASAWADYDNDGDLDLFITNRDDRNNQLFRNETAGNNWVEIKLKGTSSGTSALVSKVKVNAEINGNDIWQLRELNAQYGYNSQDDSRQHFGLGNAQTIDSIIVEWSSGKKDVFTNISVNQIYTIDEDAGLTGVTSIENQDPLQLEFILNQNYPNPFNPTTTISFVVATPLHPSPVKGEGLVSLSVYDILGNKISTLLNKPLAPGNYQINFDGADFSSGVYFYILTANGFSTAKKMILLK